MKGIRKRGDMFYVDVTINGVRRTATCGTHLDAVEKQIALKAALKHRAGPGWTMAEALDETTRVGWGDCAAKDRLVMNGQLACDHFGKDTLLSAITTSRVDRYIASLKARGNGSATINRKLAALSKLFTIATQCGGFEGQRPYLRRGRESPGRIRILTEEEECSLLAEFKRVGKSDHHDAAVVLLDTGLRPSELWRLERRDVDLVTDVIHIWVTKKDKPKSLPLTDRVKAILTNRRHELVSGKLFPFKNEWFYASWIVARKAIGLAHDKSFIPYALRHTCASRLIQRGVEIATVQLWLGHRNIQTTLRYAHLAPANLRSAMAVLQQKKAV